MNNKVSDTTSGDPQGFVFINLLIFILQLSEFFNKVLSDSSSLFKSFDFVIKGKVPFPRQNVEFYRYWTIIPVGPIPMLLRKLCNFIL